MNASKILRKILVFEFDGGSWNVLNPLLSQGKMPNLKRLMEEGAYGVLHSDSPTISPRIWTTIFTGKQSCKHGVEFFASTSSMVRQKRLWDIFSEKGLKVGVFGSLVTWPPYPINGFMIPSIFSLGPETYPEEYSPLQEIAVSERKKVHKGEKKRLIEHLMANMDKRKRLKSIGVTPETLRMVLGYILKEKVLRLRPRDRYWQKASLHLRMTVDVFLNLYKRFQPDFVTFHNHLCDAVSHRYWDCYEPQNFEGVSPNDIRKYGGVIPATYILTDNMLGRILSHLDPETTVIICSDHGAKAIPNTLKPYNLNFDNFLSILKVKDHVVPARFGLKSLLYFTDNKLKDAALETIRAITISETGEPIFNVESKEQYIALNPVPQLWRRDIPGDTPVSINGFGTYPFSEIFSQQKLKISGIHHKEGIFIAHGPGIKKGAKPVNASVFDMTPTVLSLMGYPVAKDMDGRVLTEIFTDQVLKDTPVQFIDTYENAEQPVKEVIEEVDIEKIKGRLSALGYL